MDNRLVRKGFAIAVLLFGGLAFAGTAAKPGGATGTLEIDVTDVLGHDLDARVELRPSGGGETVAILALKGKAQQEVPAGQYKAYVSVYFFGVPILVDVRDIAIEAGGSEFLLLNLLEGTSGKKTLLEFDRDCDLAIDRVEIECKTDPDDPSSIPGEKRLVFANPVLADKAGWYRGDLHVHSSYGIGKESVKDLVKRAEKTKLDFLAITDRNTMAASRDSGFKSDSVVLIPGLEWGTDKRGVALIYAPGTFPALVDRIPEAMALVDRVQLQAGFFGIAHPCFPTAPWQWGLGFVNGVEVWCRDWNVVPPADLKQIDEDLKERVDGKLVHSIAYAVATGGLSANGQASVFYDCELVRGLKAAAIAGSCSSGPKVPLGEPLTYVYARQKSLRGILEGMLQGRTYVSCGPKGPQLLFDVDILSDGSIDVPLGSAFPLNIPVTFEVGVTNAKGKELQVLMNGYPLISKIIENDSFAGRFDYVAKNYSEFRLRVTAPLQEKSKGFSPLTVLAMSSPICGQDVKIEDAKLEAYNRHMRAQPAKPDVEIHLPASPGPGEIVPTWRY